MWKTIKLGDLCDILDTLRKPITKKFRKHGPYPYYGATGIVDYVDDYIFNETLVLVGEDGAKWDAGEKTAFIVSGKYWVNNHAHVLKPHSDKLSNKWLVYYLNGIDLKPWITGLTVPKLNQEKIKSIPIPLPPLAEQKHIVAKLDAAFAEIDKKTDNINQNIKNAEGLEVKFILKEIEKLDKSNLKKLSSVCDLTRGPFGGSLTKAMFVQKGFAIYEQKHAIRNNFETIKYFISEEKFNEMKRFELRAGDLLMSCSGTLGRIAVVPENIKRGIINQALLKITPNKSIISKEYLKLIIISDYFQKILWNLSEGAAQVNVPSVKILKNILISVPGIKKQEEIIKKISTLNNLRLENLYTQKKSLLESLKASILSNFLNINNKAA